MKIDISSYSHFPESALLDGSGSSEDEFPNVLRKRVKSEAVARKNRNITEPSEHTVNSLVSLGKINSKNATVSELLFKKSGYGGSCWNIIYNDINRSKPYTTIPDGTEIFINPENKELLWGGMLKGRQVSVAALESNTLEPVKQPIRGTISEKFVNAVESYIGKEYGEVDCYELVVEGLEKLGVRYRGEGGLSEHLTVLARKEGRPFNSYMTGEGIVSASGSIVYSKTVDYVSDPGQETDLLIKEIENKLEKGSVLSFSTPTRGHTGVVSNKHSVWTYINSGVQNNTIIPGIRKKGVGEEVLSDEIRSWFNMASKRKEPITVTIGKFDEDKLAVFANRKAGVSIKA